MKRFCITSVNGSPFSAAECEDGHWVPYDEAQAALEFERSRAQREYTRGLLEGTVQSGASARALQEAQQRGFTQGFQAGLVARTTPEQKAPNTLIVKLLVAMARAVVSVTKRYGSLNDAVNLVDAVDAVERQLPKKGKR